MSAAVASARQRANDCQRYREVVGGVLGFELSANWHPVTVALDFGDAVAQNPGRTPTHSSFAQQLTME